IYHSPDLGLSNQWNLWEREDSTLIISLRGSVGTKGSWVENFYSGTIKATGSIAKANGEQFKYKLAESDDALVHAGWLIGIAYLAPDLREKISTYYGKGYRDFLMVGHSQGGALTILMRAYLEYSGLLRKDVNFKTYSSAAPKPGNQAFANNYNFITRNGWAFRVISDLDWVPETPISVQTFEDCNDTSPFRNAEDMFQQIGPVKRMAIKSVYNSMAKDLMKAQKRMNKNVSKRAFKYVEEELPGLPEPEIEGPIYYVACGAPIVLLSVDGYDEFLTTLSRGGAFTHHMFDSYWYLINKHYPVESTD
ncbi:MAG: lipase family protein, partial [Flavobacteriales bacterium]